MAEGFFLLCSESKLTVLKYTLNLFGFVFKIDGWGGRKEPFLKDGYS